MGNNRLCASVCLYYCTRAHVDGGGGVIGRDESSHEPKRYNIRKISQLLLCGYCCNTIQSVRTTYTYIYILYVCYYAALFASVRPESNTRFMISRDVMSPRRHGMCARGDYIIYCIVRVVGFGLRASGMWGMESTWARQRWRPAGVRKNMF